MSLEARLSPLLYSAVSRGGFYCLGRDGIGMNTSKKLIHSKYSTPWRLLLLSTHRFEGLSTIGLQLWTQDETFMSPPRCHRVYHASAHTETTSTDVQPGTLGTLDHVQTSSSSAYYFRTRANMPTPYDSVSPSSILFSSAFYKHPDYPPPSHTSTTSC